MQLNLGCGNYRADGWYNVDIFPYEATDCVADIVTLPLVESSVDKVYLGNVLHYLTWDDSLKALDRVSRLLKPGGWVLAVGPDLDKVDRTTDQALWQSLHDGWMDERDDDHARSRWDCTAGEMLSLFRAIFASPVPVQLTYAAAHFPVVSAVTWQCAVMAHKPL